MEEEIDLRPYIAALLKRWYWLVGAALLAGVVAFVATSLIPATYEATALVAVVAPRDVVQLDVRIREASPSQPLRAFPQLALSDRVLQAVLASGVSRNGTVQGLRERLSASVGDDTSIMHLKAKAASPAEAAALVNGWAAIFTDWANEVYGNQGGQPVAIFEGQLVEVQAELVAAEAALIEFQAVNRTGIISNTLLAHMNAQADYLASQRLNGQLGQQVQGLRDQLVLQSGGVSVGLADQLTALALQLQVFQAQTAVPIQFQVGDSTTLTSNDRGEQVALLDNLLTILAGHASQIEAELALLEPLVLEAQQAYQTAVTEYNNLERHRLVVEQTYIALAHKVETERINAQDMRSGVRLASEAAVPVEPVSRNRMMGAVLAFTAVLLLGGFIVIGISWWDKSSD